MQKRLNLFEMNTSAWSIMAVMLKQHYQIPIFSFNRRISLIFFNHVHEFLKNKNSHLPRDPIRENDISVHLDYALSKHLCLLSIFKFLNVRIDTDTPEVEVVANKLHHSLLYSPTHVINT